MTRRRSPGTGSLYKRKSDSRWVASLLLGHDQDGKRVRVTVYGRTQREAAQKLEEAIAQRHQGLLVAPDKQSVAEYLQLWLRDVVEPHRAANTVTTYRTMVHRHIVPVIGDIPLQKLTPQDVQRLSNALQAKEGLGPRSAHDILVVLSVALNVAVKWQLVARNVAHFVDKPKFRPMQQHPLTEEEARAFLEAAKDDLLYPLFALALSTGMRRGELLGLDWQDIDLEKRVVHVRASQHQSKGRQSTKSRYSERDIPLTPSVVGILRPLRQLGGPVFLDSRGKRVSIDTLTDGFKAVLRRAELPNIRFHDCRHTVATIWLRNGVNVKAVSRLLGHASIQTTLSIYAHVFDEDKESAALVLDRLFA